MMRGIVAALLVIGVTTAAFAQEDNDEKKEKVVTLPYDGPDFFCHILFAKGITPVASIGDAVNDPTNTMVIIWGQWHSTVANFLLDRERKYRQNGGNLFVASDYRIDLNELNLSITGVPVFAPDTECFGGHTQCPWLSYQDPGAEDGHSAREHPLFHLLQNRIATNRPTTLTVQNSELKPMLPMPRKKLGRFGLGASHYYVAVSPKDAPPVGRTLVIAGHGMFTNGMMLQPETDNFAFAINAVEWLREGPNGKKRTRALFMMDGEIITNFDRNLSPPLPPIPIPTVEMVNRLLRGLEDEGFFHWALRQVMGESYRNAVPLLFGIGTCALLFYGAKKFLDGRVSRENAVPRMVGMPAGKPADERAKQRQKALYRQGDVSADARMLAQQWLSGEFGLHPEQIVAGDVAIRVAGFFLTRAWLQRQVDFVTQLACSDDAAPVSRSRFVALIHSLPRLTKAHRAGRLTLLLNGKEVT